MSLRHLVPTIALIGLVPAASAAEGLSIGGFVDTILTISDDRFDDDPATATDERDPNAEFFADVELRIGYNIGDKIGARFDVEFHNSQPASAGAGDEGVVTDLEQAFVKWAVADKLSWTVGKFTSHLGWVAADADGLYRINAGPIVALYGTDLVGTSLNYAASEQLGVGVFLVNGYGTLEPDRYTGEKFDAGRRDYMMGVGVDVTWAITDLGSINVEALYDPQSGLTGVDADDAGDVAQIGVNATIVPKGYDKLAIGAELIYRNVGESDAGDDDFEQYGALAMLNHQVGLGFPASVTLMYQRLDSEAEEVVDPAVNELAIALLTNPTGDTKFGWNFEFGYTWDDGASGRGDPGLDTRVGDDAWQASMELLAVLP